MDIRMMSILEALISYLIKCDNMTLSYSIWFWWYMYSFMYITYKTSHATVIMWCDFLTSDINVVGKSISKIGKIRDVHMMVRMILTYVSMHAARWVIIHLPKCYFIIWFPDKWYECHMMIHHVMCMYDTRFCDKRI